MVYLITKNIKTKRPNQKLDFKYIKPYKIIKKISENNYKLKLLPKVKLYLIFYVSLLKLTADIIKIDTG